MSRRGVILVNLVSILAVLAVFEIGTRIVIGYYPGYYTGVRTSSSCLNYPYGDVCLNSQGYPDDEFNLDSGKPRVGYFGDSICYGVGAGRGHRITDLLKQKYPDHEHFNFCYLGENVLNEVTLTEVKRIARRYKLSHAVYLMNLNDIAPLVAEMESGEQQAARGKAGEARAATGGSKRTAESEPMLVRIKKTMAPVDELLRGRSYLYTAIRNLIKERLTVAGYEASGYKAIELFPRANDKAFKYAGARIDALNGQLSEQSIHLTVVVLPYEMQVSGDAAAQYQRMNIAWEAGFTAGEAQKTLMRHVGKQVRVIDAYHAFDTVREGAKVGEYFVYDKGDKIDWNHPNRAGHRLIADYLIRQPLF